MSREIMGSSTDEFLKAEGTFEEVHTQAVKQVVEWRLVEAIKTRKISKGKTTDTQDEPFTSGPSARPPE